MRHYRAEYFESDEIEGVSERGKYASRRDIARNGSFKKHKKETHKLRPSRNQFNHANNPETF